MTYGLRAHARTHARFINYVNVCRLSKVKMGVMEEVYRLMDKRGEGLNVILNICVEKTASCRARSPSYSLICILQLSK